MRQALWAFESGMLITVDEALRVSPVWCAMDTIVRHVAPCPWNVYDVRGRNRELRPDDALAYLLNTRANPWTTAIAHREGLLWSALGWSSGYSEIQFDNAGRVAALWNLDPTRVQPKVDASSGELGYEVRQPDNGTKWVEPWRIYHLRNTSLSGYQGDHVIGRAARSISIAAASQQFAAAYFANGTVLSGYFTTEKPLQPGDKNTLKREWAEEHSGGPGVKHKSPIFPPGLKWTPLNAEPEKAQLLETRQFSVPDVARWFGVPLHLLFDPQGSQGYGTNLETNGIGFYNGTLAPWAERHEQEADFKLLPARPVTRETKIDLSRHTRGDFKTRMEGWAVAKKAGLASANEARESEGWNTIGPDGDKFFVETSVQPLDRALNPPKPAPPSDPFQPSAPKDPASAARLAVALDRFERRISARRADLERHAPDKVEANLSEERKRLMPALLAEFRAALGKSDAVDMQAKEAAGAVLTGEPAHLAAKRIVEAG